MSNPIFVPPTVPLNNYPGILAPYSNVTPFTDVDRRTIQHQLEGFIAWLNSDVINHTDTTFATIGARLNDFTSLTAAQQAQWQSDVNDAIDAYKAATGTDIAQYKSYFDATKLSVNTWRQQAEAARVAAEQARDLAASYATTVTGTSAMTESQVLVGLIPKPIMDIPPAQPWYGKTQGASIATVATVSGATAGGSGYVTGDTITIAGGTFNKPAIFRVTANGGGVTSLSLVQGGLYTTSQPSNPVQQASTSGNGTGAQLNVTFSAAGTSFAEGEFTDVNPGNTAKMMFTGYGPVDVNGTTGWGASAGNAGEWTWETDASFLELFFLSFNSQYQLWIDGQRVQLTPRSSDPSGASLTWQLDIARDQTKVRQFRLFTSNALLTRIRHTKDGSVSTFRKPTRVKPLVLGVGDSYMQGSGAKDPSLTSFRVMCELLGVDSHPDGVGGAGWINSTSGSATSRVTNNFPKLSRTPDLIVFDLGYNDYGSDLNAVGAAMDTTIAAAKAAYPGVTIIGFSPATPLGETGQLAALKVKMQERYNAAGVKMIDMANVINAGNKSRYTDPDNVHPTPVGHVYLGAIKAQAVRGLNVL